MGQRNIDLLMEGAQKDNRYFARYFSALGR